VAQRPLSRLQYRVPYLSRLQRICLSQYLNLWLGVRSNESRVYWIQTRAAPCYDLQ